MRASRFEWDGSDPRALAAKLRGLQPGLAEVSDAVAEIISEVKGGGDEAVLAAEERFGSGAARSARAGTRRARLRTNRRRP